ncbi:MAG TPA: YggT family protein [Dehalococcoidia bacterium]
MLLFAIVLRAVISWFPINPRSPWVIVLNEITEPILAPLRRVVPQLGMIDITPMVAMIVLLVIQRALAQAG